MNPTNLKLGISLRMAIAVRWFLKCKYNKKYYNIIMTDECITKKYNETIELLTVLPEGTDAVRQFLLVFFWT